MLQRLNFSTQQSNLETIKFGIANVMIRTSLLGGIESLELIQLGDLLLQGGDASSGGLQGLLILGVL